VERVNDARESRDKIQKRGGRLGLGKEGYLMSSFLVDMKTRKPRGDGRGEGGKFSFYERGKTQREGYKSRGENEKDRSGGSEGIISFSLSLRIDTSMGKKESEKQPGVQ